MKYGGYGYHHLLVNVIPRLRAKGVDDAELRRLLVENRRVRSRSRERGA